MLYPAMGALVGVGACHIRSTCGCGIPVPDRRIAIALFPLLLLLIVNCPLKEVEVVGSNCTFSVADDPEAIVAGNVIPEIENPVPLTIAEFNVTDEDPTDESVSVCVAGVFSAASPKEML